MDDPNNESIYYPGTDLKKLAYIVKMGIGCLYLDVMVVNISKTERGEIVEYTYNQFRGDVMGSHLPLQYFMEYYEHE